MSSQPPSPRKDKRRTLCLALLFFVPLLTVILAVGALLFLVHTGTEDHALRDIEQQVVANLGEQLRYDIKTITSDLLFLAHQHDTDSLFAADGSIRQATAAKLLKDFMHICETKGIYNQVRILDADGMEALRVNYDGKHASIVPKQELQAKGHRYYFQDTFKLDRNAIYVSPLDLNVEHGAIEHPLKPTLRFATPIFDQKGHKRGILILNYLAERMLHSFNHSPRNTSTITMLINRDGYWLRGPRPEMEWGFMFADRLNQTFAAAYPEVWQQIHLIREGQLATPAGLFTFTTVSPLSAGMFSSAGNPDLAGDNDAILPPDGYFWKVVSLVPRKVLDIERHGWLRKVEVIIGVIAVLLGFVCLRLARARILREHAQASLQMRERYLQALTQGAETLLQAHHDIPFQEYLACIGPASEASRAFIFLTPEPAAEKSPLQLLAEWRSTATTLPRRNADHEPILPLRQHFPRWEKILATGGIIAGSAEDFPADERAHLESREIKSILVFPLLVDNRLHGLMEFANCLSHRSWQEAEVNFLRNATNHLTQVIKQRQYEAALLRAKDEWERTFDSVSDSIAIIDRQHHIIRVNKALAAQAGLEPRECVGKFCHQLLHNQSSPLAECPHLQMLRDGKSHAVELHDPATDNYFHVAVSPIFTATGELFGSVHVSSNITHRKRAEAALQASHQRLLTVFDSLDALVYVIDMESLEILFLNHYAKNIFGDVTGRVCWQAIQSGQDGPCDFCPNETLRQGGVTADKTHVWEAYNSRNNRWYENRDKAILWLNGRLVKIQIGTDITERRETQDALQAREEQLRTLINATPDIVCFKDGEGRWLEANQADLELFHLQGVDYRHRKDSELAAETLPIFKEAFLACEQSDEKAWLAKQALQSEEIIPGPDGNDRIYDIIKVPVFDDDDRRRGLVVLGREVTQRKRAEEKLREYAETQEVLLREVNHRVKNNLAAIISMLHKEEDRAESTGSTGSISLLRDLEGRIRGLSAVHSLLTEHAWRPLPITDVCECVVQAAVQTAPLGHAVNLQVTESPIKVSSAQAHHLAMVINELATNSVKHGLADREKSLIRIDIASEEDGMVRIGFRDDGPGFPNPILTGDFHLANIGFDLINGIVKRSLRGTIARANDHGAVTTIRFKNEAIDDSGEK